MGTALAAFPYDLIWQILLRFTDKETGSVVPFWLCNSILWLYRNLTEAFSN